MINATHLHFTNNSIFKGCYIDFKRREHYRLTIKHKDISWMDVKEVVINYSYGFTTFLDERNTICSSSNIFEVEYKWCKDFLTDKK